MCSITLSNSGMESKFINSKLFMYSMRRFSSRGELVGCRIIGVDFIETIINSRMIQ
jgi:hypothetical protein